MRCRLVSFAWLTVAGCASHPPPDYASRGLPDPSASWSRAAAEAEPELRSGGLLTLARAAEIALARHPDLARARHLAIAADARVAQAVSAYLPQLSVGAGHSRSTKNPAAEAGDLSASKLDWHKGEEIYRIGFSLRQLLFDFGRTAAQAATARASAEAARAETVAAAADVVLEVRESFLTHLADRSLLAVAEGTVASFERHLAEAERRLAIGRGTPADVAKSRVDLASARLDRLRAANRAALSRLRLNRALGLAEDPGYVLEAALPDQRLAIPPEAALADAFANRPELVAAFARLAAAESALDVARAGHWPSASLGASFDGTGDHWPLVWNWTLGPSVEWNLFNGWRTTAEVAEAEAATFARRAEAAALANTVYREVREAWLGLQEAEERIELAASAVEAAKESARLAEGRVRTGRGTILEQTDAELAFSRARAEMIRARYDYEIGAARLLRAVGFRSPRRTREPHPTEGTEP